MKWKSLANPAIAVFVALQLVYPISGLMTDKFDTWGSFTWNMYSETYTCNSFYWIQSPDGQKTPINIRKFFRRSGRTARIFHRDFLPSFNAWLCDQLTQERMEGTLMARCDCKTTMGIQESLVDSLVGICDAPNYGVIDDSTQSIATW